MILIINVEKISKQMKEIDIDNLLNIVQFQVIFNKLNECLTDNENEMIHTALASDAATVKPGGTGNNALNSKYKSQIIHIVPNQNGR